MMNDVGIIHMGGRIYDPTLGRFLQADPFIQAPKNSQSYNRYSYVLNNPLSYTDPSGYFFKKLWQATTGKILRAIAKVPILNTAINVGLNFIPGCQVWCSAAFSAATTYAVTGSLKAAFTSGAITAATAYAFSEIGSHFNGLDESGSINFGGNMLTSGQVAQQITAHALVGGVSSSLQGGKFGHGFFSAGVTKGIGGAFLPGGDNLSSGEIAQGTVVSAVIGGTASKISGGKFANGAQTGAFQYLFNQAGESLKRNLATPEQAKIIQQVRALAQDAADEWDNACAQAGGAPACAPSKRGTHIHKLFAIKLDNLGSNFAGEVSYLDGTVQRYGLKDTVRADGIYGPATAPQLVFELKTGYRSWLSVKEARNYATQLPKNEWGLVVIKVH
jgi:RHS repeat-associated protein